VAHALPPAYVFEGMRTLLNGGGFPAALLTQGVGVAVTELLLAAYYYGRVIVTPSAPDCWRATVPRARRSGLCQILPTCRYNEVVLVTRSGSGKVSQGHRGPCEILVDRSPSSSYPVFRAPRMPTNDCAPDHAFRSGVTFPPLCANLVMTSL